MNKDMMDNPGMVATALIQLVMRAGRRTEKVVKKK